MSPACLIFAGGNRSQYNPAGLPGMFHLQTGGRPWRATLSAHHLDLLAAGAPRRKALIQQLPALLRVVREGV